MAARLKTLLFSEDWIELGEKLPLTSTFLFSIDLDTVERQLSAPVVLYLHDHEPAFPDIFEEKTFHKLHVNKPTTYPLISHPSSGLNLLRQNPKPL